MNKKLLLIVLPALMALASCQAGNLKNENKNIFLEDTLAHEEVFGGEKAEGRKLVPFKVNGDPVEHPDDDPAIGIQYLINDNGTAGDQSDDTVSFRFVAAVTFNNENIGSTVAKWTRTISKPNGDAYSSKFDTDEVTVEKAYTKISNGGGEYTIGQFNTANGTSYTHFVVYCLRNIPLIDPYNDYYVSAYLSLTGGVSQISKAVVISVDQSKQYSYDHELGLSFITGEFNGNPGVINATFIRDDMGDGNKAEFEGLVLTKDDTFVINEFYNTKLYVKNSAKFGGDSNYYLDDDEGMIKVNFSGNYNIYLTNSDQIHTTASNVVRKLYVSLVDDTVKDWWEDDENAFTALYAYVNGAGGAWYTLTKLAKNSYITDDEIDPTEYDRVIAVKINKSALSNQSTWWDNKVVQTHGDANGALIPHSSVNDCAYVKQEYAMGPCYIDWGNHN